MTHRTLNAGVLKEKGHLPMAFRGKSSMPTMGAGPDFSEDCI